MPIYQLALLLENPMVKVEDVRATYRLILGREPESEEALAYRAQRAHSLEDLRKNHGSHLRGATIPGLPLLTAFVVGNACCVGHPRARRWPARTGNLGNA